MTDITTPEKTVYRFQFAARPDAARLGRAFVGSALRYWRMPQLTADARLVVSELVSNASAATPGSDITLTIEREKEAVLIGVWDSSAQEPVPRAAGPTDTTGRGLFIVASLAFEDGWYADAGGKVVWARLRTGREDADAAGRRADDQAG